MNERFTGIVLFTQSYRDHDTLVKIFTPEYGTKMFFVKHAKHANHHLASQLIPLTYNEYLGDIKDLGLSFIREAHTLNLFSDIQMDYWKQAHAVYIAQLIDAGMDDNTPMPVLYQLIHDALLAFSKKIAPEIIAIYVEIAMLPFFGVEIEWQQCRHCQKMMERVDFSILQQGVLCHDHWNEDDYRLQAQPSAMKILRTLARTPLRQLNSVTVKEETICEMRRIMDEIYTEFVGIRLKSKSYLKQLHAFQDKMTKQLRESRGEARSTDENLV